MLFSPTMATPRPPKNSTNWRTAPCAGGQAGSKAADGCTCQGRPQRRARRSQHLLRLLSHRHMALNHTVCAAPNCSGCSNRRAASGACRCPRRRRLAAPLGGIASPASPASRCCPSAQLAGRLPRRRDAPVPWVGKQTRWPGLRRSRGGAHHGVPCSLTPASALGTAPPVCSRGGRQSEAVPGLRGAVVLDEGDAGAIAMPQGRPHLQAAAGGASGAAAVAMGQFRPRRSYLHCSSATEPFSVVSKLSAPSQRALEHRNHPPSRRSPWRLATRSPEGARPSSGMPLSVQGCT